MLRLVRMLAVFAMCTLAAGTAGAQAPALTVINLATNGGDDVTPILYAQQSGMFARAGIDVKITKAASGQVVTQGVLAGAYDVGKSSVVPLMAAHQKDLPVAIVAPGGVYDVHTIFNEIVVLKDTPYRSGRDLEGKTVGTPGLHDAGQLGILAWIEKTGGDTSKIKFVEVPQSTSLAALEAGRIDATALFEPWLTPGMATGHIRSVGATFASIAPHFVFSAWFSTKGWIAAHPAAARAFARTVMDAARYTNAHPAETALMASEFTGIPLDAIRKMHRVSCGTALAPSDLQAVIDTAVKYKELDRSFRAEELLDRATLGA